MAVIINAKIPLLKKGYHRMTLPFGNQKLGDDDYLHKGIDLTGKTDVSGGYDDILAFADGEIITAGYLSDTGYWVRIRHTNGIITRYMHMKKGSIKVKVGDNVKKGQVIGSMGSTGNSTNRHLHFDISYPGNVVLKHGGFYVSSQNVTYVDPIPYVTGEKSIATSTATSKYTTGKYKVVKDVNVRTGPGTKYPRVMYKGFTANAKEQIKKLGGNPKDNDFPKGMVLTLKVFDQDENGAWWGECPTGWVFIKGYLVKT
ncbi:MAG: peptidoglycan DD-metalloendopeptidase family protein [Clostridia bacterium]|nr:peptidoglycan DD-metalloendopeptidase family protein [Clostridia bacterium]